MTEGLSSVGLPFEVGAALRAIRESQGKTIEQVSKGLSEVYVSGFSASKISRLELGERRPSPRDVLDLCTYYGVDPDERDRLVRLAVTTRSANRLQRVSAALASFVALEASARTLRNYEPMFIPGLLQTSEYHRAAIDSYALSGVEPYGSAEKYETNMRVRRERQQRLEGPRALTLDAVIDENVVRRIVGSPALMSAQLRHLADMSSRPNITVRVIPASCGLYPGCDSAGFTLLEFGDGPPRQDDVCLAEGVAGSVWIERAADRLRFAGIFEYLATIAYDTDRSRALIEDAAAALARR